jgi:hypothetical protein
LERILAQLLEKDPDLRIPNADILARRLEALLQSLSVVPDTVAADPSWFSPVPSKPTPEDAPSPASADEIPETQVLTQPEGNQPIDQASDQEDATLPKTVILSSSLPPVPVEPAVPMPPSGHFIAVHENELGQIEEETPRTSIFSWRTSWQTWALAAALLLVGWSLRWFLQPPTADALLQQISAKMGDEQSDSHLLKLSDVMEAEGLIEDFLNRYPDDPNAGRVREFSKKLSLRHLELNFEQSIKGRTGTDNLPPIKQLYLEAMSYARFDPTRAMTKLQALIDLYHQPMDDRGQTELCLALARHQLAQLSKEVEKLAAEQRSMLQERLDSADALRKNDPERAKATYRAVVELYGEKPWAADAVLRARKALQK